MKSGLKDCLAKSKAIAFYKILLSLLSPNGKSTTNLDLFSILGLCFVLTKTLLQFEPFLSTINFPFLLFSFFYFLYHSSLIFLIICFLSSLSLSLSKSFSLSLSLPLSLFIFIFIFSFSQTFIQCFS